MCRISIIASVLFIACMSKQPFAQSLSKPVNDGKQENIEAVSRLNLPQALSSSVQSALDRRDYQQSQELLIAEINSTPNGNIARRDLILLGYLFFRDAKYLNAWIAWDKAQAIEPLDDDSLFSMAMADLELKRPDRALTKIEELENRNPRNAVFGYWHARFDYDAHQYLPAIARLQRVVMLDPTMVRAYDRLGLCYMFMNRPDAAVSALQRAVALNRSRQPPSAWPDVDFAVLLTDAGRFNEARTALQEAMLYNSRLSQAHYQLGLILEKQGRSDEARSELERAVALDQKYPEPHFALQRILLGIGKKDEAAAQGEAFQRLKNPQASASLDTQ